MDLFKFKLLSKYHETNSKKYKRYVFPQIISLRFVISPTILPTAVKILNNNQTVAEHLVEKSDMVADKIYFNLWINLGKSLLSVNYIKIYLKIFGIYIRVKTLEYSEIKDTNQLSYMKSDSYIDPSIIGDSNINGHELETEIKKLPSPLRSTSTKLSNIDISSILLMRLDQLGDFVVTLPAIYELKSQFPQSKITILVSPSNEGIAKSIDIYDEVITVQFSFIENTNYRALSTDALDYIRENLKKSFYDIAIDLSPMPETREILDVVNAKFKFGFENTDTSMIDFGLLIHAKDNVNSLSNIPHAVYPLMLIDAVKRVIVPSYKHFPKLKYNESDLINLKLTSRSYIAVHSGARNLLVRWPLTKFLSLTHNLITHGYRIVFFSDETIPFDQKSLLLNSGKVTVIDEKISFDQFDTIISNSLLFIGNDSGPKHLAAMRNVPVLSIHSPRTNWSEWGQIDSGYIISRNFPCAGCAITEKPECAKDLECITGIRVEEVLSAAFLLLHEIK